ncbi:MAG: cell division protein ZapB [Geobacteraceae bacterium]|nr:cell division protein ZapB [Geobacteraceae bacterium]
MDTELFDILESKIEGLVHDLTDLKLENTRLREENQGLIQEREVFKARIDSILKKLEGI